MVMTLITPAAPAKPQKPQKAVLTKSQRTLLKYYLKLGQRFCLNLDLIHKATGIPVRTITRANRRLAELNILSWIPGHGGDHKRPNQYRLDDSIIAMTGPQQGRKAR